jgi:hypothetical protein
MVTVLNLFSANFIYVQFLKFDVILLDNTNLNGGWDLRISEGIFVMSILDYSPLENNHDYQLPTETEY